MYSLIVNSNPPSGRLPKRRSASFDGRRFTSKTVAAFGQTLRLLIFAEDNPADLELTSARSRSPDWN